jgi:ATP-dependent Clp protease ATP-binding subunit ClpA
VEATAEALLGNPRAVIKIDCGEFQHSHEIAKLIGSPPGYCAPTLTAKLSRTGVEAARRKFTPEFLNRLDRIVVFKALGSEELNRIIDIELELVQERVQTAAAGKPFFINVTGSARKFLLTEGVDLRYGARPLKRAIERLLVQPLSSLMATGQIQSYDRIRVTHHGESPSLTFFRETDAWQTWKTHGVAA